MGDATSRPDPRHRSKCFLVPITSSRVDIQIPRADDWFAGLGAEMGDMLAERAIKFDACLHFHSVITRRINRNMNEGWEFMSDYSSLITWSVVEVETSRQRAKFA